MTIEEELFLDTLAEAAKMDEPVRVTRSGVKMALGLVRGLIKERDALIEYRVPKVAVGDKCPRCGIMVNAYDNFCVNCGQGLLAEDCGGS